MIAERTALCGKTVAAIFCCLLMASSILVRCAHSQESKKEVVSFDFKDADVRAVFRILADAARLNLVVGKGVTGKVTVRLREVGVLEGIELIARLKGWRVRREGGLFVEVL